MPRRRAVCYIDGRYACGLGANPPARDAYVDVDTRYKTELERFTNEMLPAMQVYLARRTYRYATLGIPSSRS